MATDLRAFHGDADLKQQLLARVEAHRLADEIVQGHYYREADGKVSVCAVGCVFHDPHGGHQRYESELGIPEAIARLEDLLFERMELSRAKTWPGEFLAAIPVGADLSLVIPKFLAWLMGDLEQFTYGRKEVLTALRIAGALWVRAAAGQEVPAEEWRAASATAAYSAAAYSATDSAATAVYSATDSAAAAAYSATATDSAAVYSATDYAASAADSAAAASAYSAYPAAYSAAYSAASAAASARMADKLLELLAAAPVPEAPVAVTA